MVLLFPFCHLPFDDGGFLLPFGAFVSGQAHRMQNYITSVGTNEWDDFERWRRTYVNAPTWSCRE
jgi:hypothetical protein